MKKLFVSGLILALLLVAIPVAADNSSATENSDVVQMNITPPAPSRGACS